MSSGTSITSSNRYEASEQPSEPRRQPRHEWWTCRETGEEFHQVDFGYEQALQLDDRGNLFAIFSRTDPFQLLHPIHAGFSVPLSPAGPLAPYSGIADVDRSQYEELNQAVRERVYLEGWSQQGALLPGQEALRRRDIRDMADHIDNQPREASRTTRIHAVLDLLDLKDVDTYIDKDGTIQVEKLSHCLSAAQRCITRGLNPYVMIQDSTTSNYARFLRYSNMAGEAVAHLQNKLPHSFDTAAQFARAMLKTRIALAALRLSIEWYLQQNPKYWDEMDDSPSLWHNLLKILCDILPSLWNAVQGNNAAEHAARRVNATLLVLKTIGQHIDRAPSFLTMYTLRELGMVMLDGEPTDALHYQNWSFEPETASDKAWEDMGIYLTGHHYHHIEKDVIKRLGNRGTRLYRGLENLCKSLLALSRQMRELDVVKTRVSHQTYSDLNTVARLLTENGQRYNRYARNVRPWLCDIRAHKRDMQNLAERFDELRHKINTQAAIITCTSTNPDNEDCVRKRHALSLLEKVAEVLELSRRNGETFLVHLCRYPPVDVAYHNLEKLVYRGEEMVTVYETHKWYAEPLNTDEEAAWNEFKVLLDLGPPKTRKRKRKLTSNDQFFKSRWNEG